MHTELHIYFNIPYASVVLNFLYLSIYLTYIGNKNIIYRYGLKTVSICNSVATGADAPDYPGHFLSGPLG